MKDFSEEINIGDSVEFVFDHENLPTVTNVSIYELSDDDGVLWRMEDGVMVYERDKE